MNWYEYGARVRFAEASEVRAILANIIDMDTRVSFREVPFHSTECFCIAEQLWWEGQDAR